MCAMIVTVTASSRCGCSIPFVGPMSSHLRMKDLVEKDKKSLLKQLTEYKKELSQLRVAQVMSNTASKVGKIGQMRKNVARILTVLNTKERENLRKVYADEKKVMPKSLRPKLTHKRRLALKANEQRRKSRRQLRAAAKNPKRVFAVKL